jgi:hypothetical protein
MTIRVRVLIEAEFKAHSEAQARAAATRIPGELTLLIQRGRIGLNGVVPGSVVVKVKEQEVAAETAPD